MNLSFTAQAQDNLRLYPSELQEKKEKKSKINLLVDNVHLIEFSSQELHFLAQRCNS